MSDEPMAEPPSRRTFDQALAAGIAIVSIALGAVGSYWATAAAQGSQNRRDDSKELVQARAAARLLYAEFASSGTALQVYANDRFLRSFDRSLTIDTSSDDLRLIAAHIDPDAWTAIVAAMVSIDGLEGMNKSLMKRGHTKLTAQQECLVHWDFRSVVLAVDAMGQFMGSKTPPADPPEPTCDVGPGELREITP